MLIEILNIPPIVVNAFFSLSQTVDVLVRRPLKAELRMIGFVTVSFMTIKSGGSYLSFKILKFNCCGLDVHKTWIYACIGITDSNNRTEYKQARFSSFTKGLTKKASTAAAFLF